MEKLIAGRSIVTVMVNDDPKFFARERQSFAGGWDVTTMNNKSVGFFQKFRHKSDFEVKLKVFYLV